MNPGEVIIFMMLAFGTCLVIAVSWFLLRKRKKWALAVTVILIVIFMSAYMYYPTYREVMHDKRYEQLLIYLQERYPNEQFVIEPEVYEPGYQVGDFNVRYADTMLAGVWLRVNGEGNVVQTAYWTNSDYPTQQNIWQKITTDYDAYTLDAQLPHVEKKGMWIDGEWTVFAVTIDERPALAFYRYSQAGYGRESLVEAARGEVVSAEWQNRFFIYMDEAYEGETVVVTWQGKERMVHVSEARGKLLVWE